MLLTPKLPFTFSEVGLEISAFELLPCEALEKDPVCFFTYLGPTVRELPLLELL